MYEAVRGWTPTDASCRWTPGGSGGGEQPPGDPLGRFWTPETLGRREVSTQEARRLSDHVSANRGRK